MSTKSIDLEIGKLIRKLREKKGLTQSELATKLGYQTPQFVSLFERGLSKVPFETLGQLSVILSLPTNDIKSILIRSYDEEITQRIKAGKKTAGKSL